MKQDICVHCGESVSLYDGNPKLEPWWIHTSTSAQACRPTKAEPLSEYALIQGKDD